MALNMQVTSPQGPVSNNGYVKIQNVQVNNKEKTVRYQVVHYWDQDARLADKDPVERHKCTKTLDDTPNAGINVLKECYADLKTRQTPYDYTQATDAL